jgi:hypothetical protein
MILGLMKCAMDYMKFAFISKSVEQNKNFIINGWKCCDKKPGQNLAINPLPNKYYFGHAQTQGTGAVFSGVYRYLY